MGLIVGLIAALEAFDPLAPELTGSPACPGAQIRGLPFRAVTQANGANARSGPGSTFEQVNRFPAGCSLGFDEYCVGQPFRDFNYDWPDGRWLRVPHGNGFVHAGAVLSVAPESKLKFRRCADGIPPPGNTSLTVASNPDGSSTLEARSERAYSIGFARLRTVNGRPLYEQLVLDKSPDDGFSYTGRLVSTDVVLAKACLAVEVPARSESEVKRISGPAVGIGNIERTNLEGAACELPEE